MRYSKTKFALSILTLTPMLTACWDARDVQEIIPVTALAIDETFDGTIQLSVELPTPDPKQQSDKDGDAAPQNKVVSATGKTLEDAVDALTWHVPRRLMFSHTQIVVLGRDYAKNSIKETMDFVTRHKELRTADLMFVITNGQGRDLLATRPSSAEVNAIVLRELTTSKGAKFHTGVDLLNDLLAPSKAASLPWIDLTEEGTPSIRGVGLISNFQLIRFWNAKSTRSLEWFTGPVEGEHLLLHCGSGNASILIVSGSSKVRLKSRNPLRFVVRARGTAEITNMCDKEKPSTKIMETLNEELNQKIAADLKDEINSFEHLQIDAAHFGTAMWRSDPKLWRRYQRNWPRELTNIPVDFDVRLHLLRTGFTEGDASEYEETTHEQED